MTEIGNTINNLYEDICTALHDSVMSCISKKNSSSAAKCNKPWWNRKCTLSRNRNRIFHHIWKSCGRPTSGTTYDCYKASRKAYRACCRTAIRSKTMTY